MPRRIMRAFKLHEISCVDRPAQEGARMTIMKRAQPVVAATAIAKYVAPMMDSAMKPGARTFEEVYRASEEQRRQWAANEKLWPLFSALEESLRSIAADGTVASEGKTTRIRESVDAFMEAVKRELPEVQQELAKLLTENPATAGFFNAGKRAGDHVQRKENTMPDDVKKVADLEASVTKLTTDLTAMTKRAETAELIGKMSDAEKAHYSKMSDKDKEEWAKLSDEEKKKRMDAAKSADDVVYKAADGTEFRKSDDPRLVTMAKRADESEKVAKAEREARETAEFTKRAETEAGNLPGDATLKGRVLKHLASADKDVREAGEAMLKAGDKAIAKAFDRIGKTGGKPEEGSAQAQLDALIAKHAADNKVTVEVATAAVMKSADGNRLYQEVKASEPQATAH